MLDGADLNALGIVTGTFTDSQGVARPSGGAFDIGALELAE
ncbi:MAG: choice-of-anchor Q domain-containing protein [Myxococcota bacterium]